MNNETNLNNHMLAEARLMAHLLDVALKAGYRTDEINRLIGKVVSATVISEIWISNENGEVVYSSEQDVKFSFGRDPEANDQAAKFAQLLAEGADSIVQPFMNRSIDGQTFKYVAVRGVDRARIVQVGISEADYLATQ